MSKIREKHVKTREKHVKITENNTYFGTISYNIVKIYA